jgi:hypothetical protein
MVIPLSYYPDELELLELLELELRDGNVPLPWNVIGA